MIETATAEGPPRTSTVAGASTVAAYGALGAILCVTRLVGLDRSFWHDEALTVADYVRGGPGEILFGTYIPNNHQLFSLLGWATSSLVGESELALRLWAVVPFLAGVALVAWWLHARYGALTGILYLLLATLSPLLLDLSRQARGYGLAFLAMSILFVAALEAERTRRTRWLAAAFAAGVAGTWTLPIFGVAFVATAAALLVEPALRRRVAVGLAASILAVAAWYAPHLGDLLASAEQEYGGPLPWFGVVTAPADQMVIPAVLWIEGLAPTPSLVWLPLVAVIAVVLLASPLLRERRTAWIACSGVVATVLVVWATRVWVAPRFLSFLLVPLFVLLASGAARLLARPNPPLPRLRASAAVALLALLGVQFASAAPDVLRLPREAHRDVAELIAEEAPGADLVAHASRTHGLSFYLDMPLEPAAARDVVERVCEADATVVYVEQPFAIEPVNVPCLGRSGVEHHRFEQYARGERIDVWLVPPGSDARSATDP